MKCSVFIHEPVTALHLFYKYQYHKNPHNKFFTDTSTRNVTNRSRLIDFEKNTADTC